jgi:hypothetical protein
MDSKKYFINRHDIDTDLFTTKKIFEVEKSLGIKSSYYFRLSTLDINLMREIEEAGSEASYHFEEIATLAKNHNWSKNDIDFEKCSQQFEENYLNIKSLSGLKMRSVCSHGDFVNRKLGIVNHKFLSEALRKKLGIEVETYDTEFMKHVEQRFSDTLYPRYFSPCNPQEAIQNGARIIYLLTHPRHWDVNKWENTKDNVRRVWEGIKYSPKE